MNSIFGVARGPADELVSFQHVIQEGLSVQIMSDLVPPFRG